MFNLVSLKDPLYGSILMEIQSLMKADLLMNYGRRWKHLMNNILHIALILVRLKSMVMAMVVILKESDVFYVTIFRTIVIFC